MTRFIFMLTHHDVTVAHAVDVFDDVKDTGITSVGFKDVGLPFDKMRRLVTRIKKEEMSVFLESVSLTNDDAVDTAIKLGVDYFIGGVFRKSTLNRLTRQGIRYYPYAGRVIGHPCVLRGSIDEVVHDAREIAASGVDGINLLAYRYQDNVDQLMGSIQSAVDSPLIVAGNINSFDRIEQVLRWKVWGFTIGSAIFEGKFSERKNVADQISAVRAAVEKK